MHLLGKYLFGSLFQSGFFLLLLIQLSSSWFFRWSLWFRVIFCTFWDSLLSSFAKPYHMPFCSLSRSQLDFFICSCFQLGCVDLSRVTLLYHLILRGILSVRQGTIRGLLASSISLPLFVLLIFSTSSVSKLWVYNCLEQFLYLGPFGLMRSFFWSSSQVPVHLIGICSFLVLLRHEGRWMSWTRIHVFHHALAFSILISFLVVFWVVRCVFLLWGLPRVFLVLLSYRLSKPFRYAFSVAIFSFKIVRFLWRVIVVMLLWHALLVVDRIFFHCFGVSRFVCIVLTFVDISLISLLSPELSGLFPHVVLLFFLVMSFAFCSHIFQDLSVLSFGLFSSIFYLGFQLNLPSWFWLFLRAFWGETNFLIH